LIAFYHFQGIFANNYINSMDMIYYIGSFWQENFFAVKEENYAE